MNNYTFMLAFVNFQDVQLFLHVSHTVGETGGLTLMSRKNPSPHIQPVFLQYILYLLPFWIILNGIIFHWKF